MTAPELISYRHKDDHKNKTRFVQRKVDKVPEWAADVQPHTEPMTARDRAIEMLRIAARYIRETDAYGTIHYDGTECDGYCVADDCEIAAEELEGLPPLAEALAVPTDEPEAGEERAVIIKAKWKPCVHGGGWWVAQDADGCDVLLAPDGFAAIRANTDGD